MCGEAENFENAQTTCHLMMQEAVKIAKETDAKELWLTHYSPSVYKLKRAFSNTLNIVFEKAFLF